MREIIDFHIHPFWTDAENMCFYPGSSKWEPQKTVTDLKQAGIICACGSVIDRRPWEDGIGEARGFEAIRLLNDHALLLQENDPDFYIPGVHIHPSYVKESCDELERMHQKGVRLIGELVPYMQGWSDYSSRELGQILDVAEEFDMVVSYHSMDDAQMETMIANHPGVTFVAAHPGDRDKYPLHLERLKKYPNAYLDLSGTGLFRYGMLKHGVDMVGSEKFLFGTDYPITNPHMYVQAVEFEAITEKDKELIFAGNAKRILGI